LFADLISDLAREFEEVKDTIWHRSVCFAMKFVTLKMCFLAVSTAIPSHSAFATSACAMIAALKACTATIRGHSVMRIVTEPRKMMVNKGKILLGVM